MKDERDDREPGAESVEGGGFLERWSRLKSEARAGRPPLDAPTREPPASEEPAAPVQAEPPGDEDMPPLESLTEDSDYSAFFSPRVSAGLRRAALRKLFRSPKFNVHDGLTDYARDYTRWELLGDVLTADRRHQLERAAAMAASAAEQLGGKSGAEPAAAVPREKQEATDGRSTDHCGSEPDDERPEPV